MTDKEKKQEFILNHYGAKSIVIAVEARNFGDDPDD